MTKTISIRDIDAAAFAAAKTSAFPAAQPDFDGQAGFTFTATPEIEAALVGYASGTAMIDAHRLLQARRKLFVAVRELRGRQ